MYGKKDSGSVWVCRGQRRTVAPWLVLVRVTPYKDNIFYAEEIEGCRSGGKKNEAMLVEHMKGLNAAEELVIR